MQKILISLALTLLLGPGAGHIYLRQFKKAAIFIVSALFFAFHLAWRIAKALGTTDVTTMAPAQIMQVFNQAHPKTMFIYDAIFAAIWAYAVVDSFFVARAMTPPAPPPAEEN